MDLGFQDCPRKILWTYRPGILPLQLLWIFRTPSFYIPIRSPNPDSPIVRTGRQHPVCPIHSSNLTGLSSQLYAPRMTLILRRRRHPRCVPNIIQKCAARPCAPTHQPAPTRRNSDADIERVRLHVFVRVCM